MVPERPLVPDPPAVGRVAQRHGLELGPGGHHLLDRQQAAHHEEAVLAKPVERFRRGRGRYTFVEALEVIESGLVVRDLRLEENTRCARRHRSGLQGSRRCWRVALLHASQVQLLGQMAAGEMVIRHGPQRRYLDPAALHSIAAAGMEVTARRRVGRVGDLAQRHDPPGPAPRIGHRHGRQPPRCRDDGG